jgi:sarcosine oxidase subunit gamma
LGPDEYLLLDFAGGEPRTGEPSAGASASTLFDALETAMADVPHALVDISHRQFAFELTGSHAATILCGACPLDLDLAQFPVGMCTRTVLAKADIMLWRTRADAFHLEVWRSFAGYVTGVLTEIAAEFYPRG